MKRILAVDDNKDILEILRFILEDYGYEVSTLVDAHCFFEEIKQHVPDLILMDIMLGDLDGRDLCRKIKSENETHNIPVILISAGYDTSEIFNHNGAPNAFLTKPFDINVLLRTVKNQLAA